MNEELLMHAGIEIAEEIGARAIVSFTRPCTCQSKIPLIWVQDLKLDILRDLTMYEIVSVCEHHMLDAAVQIYLTKRFEEGTVVAVFQYAVLIFDLERVRNFVDLTSYEDIVDKDVMYSVLKLAMEIAVEGREGRKIGTAFIIGDAPEIAAHSHQAILNPYLGHPTSLRDIKNRENWESVKEFAQLDGIFIVDKSGTIATAGSYMDVNAKDVHLPGGLGGRHRATAAITAVMPAVGVTVSESGGLVRVFRDGACTITIRSDIRISG
jgi:DNA integrity scanning protein DisA with diadenylate cyclase activity